MKFLLPLLLFCSAAFASYHVPDNSVTASKFQTHQAGQITNCSFAASVAANALTITLNDGDGATPTVASPCKVDFRSSTATTGTLIKRTISSALSLVVPNGASLGCVNAISCTLYPYLIDTGSGVVLGISAFSQADESVVQSSSLITVGSNSRATIYSAVAQTSKPIRSIGKILATEAIAGTWATTPSSISIWPASQEQQVTTSQSYPLRIETFQVNGGGGVTENNGADIINGNCGLSTSTFTCTFNSGIWSQNPVCVGFSSGGQLAPITYVTMNTTTLSYITTQSGGLSPAATTWICVGARY